jgi:hypothetical protein
MRRTTPPISLEDYYAMVQQSLLDPNDKRNAKLDAQEQQPAPQREATHVVDSEDEQPDEQVEEYDGGKIHFVKSLKSIGNSKIVKGIIKDIQKVAVKEGVKALKTGVKDLMTQQPMTSQQQIEIPVAEPVGGSIKKKTSRQLSDKTKRRHALIRKIMHEKKCTMVEANKYISQNKIEY